jgi:hypothetical protein
VSVDKNAALRRARLARLDMKDVMDFMGPDEEYDEHLESGSVAVFSKCRRYRLYLRRRWDPKLPHMSFIMLNPSTADAFKNDPTVLRCQVRATRLGFGSYSVANVFAFRSTQPNAITLPNVEPIGVRNDDWIQFAAEEASQVMVGWGNHGNFNHRGDNVLGMLDEKGITLWCLGQNKGGSPVHPLYQAYEKPLRRYQHSVL